jgi:hypothetical protein
MVSLTWKVLSYFEIFNTVTIACALKFDDFHGWASGHLRACYLLCLMETSEYRDLNPINVVITNLDCMEDVLS